MNHSLKQRESVRKYENEKIVLKGFVYKLESSEFGWKLYLRDVKLNYEKSSDQLIKLNRIIVLADEVNGLKIGQKIQVQGNLLLFQKARNFGNFDVERYYDSLGIFAKILANNIRIVDRNQDDIRQNLYELKADIKRRLEILCAKSEGIYKFCKNKAEIFYAMLLGEKSEMDEELKELYSTSGIAHVLAISGLHISLIGMCLYSLLRKRFGFAPSSVISLTVVICFGLISGMGIATIRAVVMFGLKLLGETLGRIYDYLTAISVSGLMLMFENPFVIYNSAFQMSFAAIIAITLVWPQIQKCFHCKNKILKSILFGMNINTVILPIIAYNYYQLPTYSFLLNLIVVPLMSIVVASGVCGIILSYISIELGRIAIFPGCAILELYEWLCRVTGKLPYSNVIVGKPKPWEIFVYYAILLITVSVLSFIREQYEKEAEEKKIDISTEGKDFIAETKQRKQEQRIYLKFRIVFVCVFTLLICLIYINLPDGFYVTFLDVGQGDGIFIHTEADINITIDGGSTSVNEVGRYRIIPYLKAKGIRHIDYVIMTHADTDHISGLIELLEQSDQNGIQVNNLVLPDISLKDEPYRNLIHIATKHQVSTLYISKGNSMQFGDVLIQCIAPEGGAVAEERNDLSTVLSVKYKAFSMLLTGDISSEVEERLELPLTDYTVLKVAHHGSKYSSSDEFLKKLNPMFSVISVGEHNLYDHPSAEALERLDECGSKVIRTDESGGITVSSNGKNIEIQMNLK